MVDIEKATGPSLKKIIRENGFTPLTEKGKFRGGILLFPPLSEKWIEIFQNTNNNQKWSIVFKFGGIGLSGTGAGLNIIDWKIEANKIDFEPFTTLISFLILGYFVYRLFAKGNNPPSSSAELPQAGSSSRSQREPVATELANGQKRNLARKRGR